MSRPREIIDALGRGGSAAGIINHLAEHGPSSAMDISEALGITRAGARAQLIAMRAGGALALEDPAYRLMVGLHVHRYYLDPDALRYAARWLDTLAERADRAFRDAAYAPIAGRTTR